MEIETEKEIQAKISVLKEKLSEKEQEFVGGPWETTEDIKKEFEAHYKNDVYELRDQIEILENKLGSLNGYKNKQKFEYGGKIAFYYDIYDISGDLSEDYEIGVYFYNIQFPSGCMEKFNSICYGCSLDFHGKFAIDDRNGHRIVDTYITDVLNGKIQ